MHRLERTVALLAAAGFVARSAPAQNSATNALSAWQTDSARVVIRSADSPPPAPSPIIPSALPADPRRDLRVDFGLDLGARTRLDQRHGLEFSTLQPTVPPGLPSPDPAPLVRSSGSTLTFAPLDGLDFAVGSTLRQSMDAGGSVAWETVTHSFTLASNPWQDGRLALTLHQDERTESTSPSRAAQGFGLALSQKLPSAPLRLTLTPEWREATFPGSNPGTPEASGSRLAGSLAWDFAPAASWTLGSELDQSGDDAARIDTQSLNSSLRLRPAPDVNLSLSTRYAETRRESPDAPPLPAEPERDLRLRLSPSFNLNEDITAQLDFDINLRENPAAPQPSETAGGVSFSIRGRF